MTGTVPCRCSRSFIGRRRTTTWMAEPSLADDGFDAIVVVALQYLLVLFFSVLLLQLFHQSIDKEVELKIKKQK
eukprot:scaffold13788_cov74-Skeletonema_marinoi.AAC.1